MSGENSASTGAIREAFLAAANVETREMEPELDTLLAAAAERFRCEYPTMMLSDEQAAAYLGQQVASSGLELADLAECSLADLILAGACLDASADAVSILIDGMNADLPSALSQLSMGRADIDDLLSQVREKLMVGGKEGPKLRSYRGTGSLGAWIKVIATRDALRGKKRQRPHGTLTDALAAALPSDEDDPDLAYQRRLYAEAFRDAFAAAIAGLTRRERALLKQAIVHQATVDEIAAVYDVHRATAARWVAKAREHLVRETRKHLRSMLDVSPSVLESITRMVDGVVDLSVERLLGKSTTMSEDE